MAVPKTHKAVATVSPRSPLQLIDVPTVPATGNQVRVKVNWTASTPLDLHQADGGLLVKPPQVLGDGIAGTVVEIGNEVKELEIGDLVFGFTWRSQQEKAHQEFVTAEEILFGKVPEGVAPEAAVTLPNNFVTVFHTVTHDLHLELPWPRPDGYVPKEAKAPILIWGGSSSVGQYALQILQYFGYKNLTTTASSTHHEMLKDFGAAATVDYRSGDVVKNVLDAAGGEVKYVFDCIGSLQGSVEPIAKIAGAGSIVAVVLPVILKDGTVAEKPEYGMDVEKVVEWKEGVQAIGIRTHFYLENKFFAEHLQSAVMPAMLASGDVKANRQRIVEGDTLLERAENALDMLRRKVPSAERLVWRVSE